MNTHHILLPIGILLAVPATFAASSGFFRTMVDYGVMLMDVYISPRSYAVSFGLTVLCYVGSLYLLRRKVKRVEYDREPEE